MPRRFPLVVLLLLAALPLSAAADTWSALVRKYGFEERNVGLVVLDSRGRAQGAVRGDAPLKPASNQKVLVAAAALATLGPSFEYSTELWSNVAPGDGVVRGDLGVSGSGDPNISARFTGDPTAIFRGWAREFRKKGVSRFTGDVVIDDFAFDAERFVPSWKTNQLSRWYSAQVGALSLNDNCVDITIRPASIGSRARYEISPATSYVDLESSARTVRLTSKVKHPLISAERVPDSNRIVVKGKIPRRPGGEYTVPVTIHDPGMYFGVVLKEVFEKSGIRIDGRVLRDRSRVPASGERVLYHRHLSPLKLDLPVILRNSQNLHSELLLRALGRSVGEVGSVESGARAIRAYLKRLGVSADGLEVADGSGLSAENRVSARVLATVLQHVAGESYFPIFRDSLPVGGVNGTLRSRFKRRDLRGRVLAKTGTIAGVSTLSGYVFASEPSAGGPFWTFSLLINGFPRGSNAFGLQEAVAREILRRMR